MNGPAGVFAARLAGAVTRSESELATIPCPPMAGKIATSKDWDPVRNTLIASSDLVHVSSLLVVMATVENYPACNRFILSCYSGRKLQ